MDVKSIDDTSNFDEFPDVDLKIRKFKIFHHKRNYMKLNITFVRHKSKEKSFRTFFVFCLFHAKINFGERKNPNFPSIGTTHFITYKIFILNFFYH